MKIITRVVLCLLYLLLLLGADAQNLKKDSLFIVRHYKKVEQMIPMRDGKKLYTAIYVPKDTVEKHPFLIHRTPYGCEPYGKAFFPEWYSYHRKYFFENYIMVYQDVRGAYMSEGDFVDIRPFNPNKQGIETDEASDAYDTIEWLLNNIKNNNGNVGVMGISYPGFYSTMAALSNHPALKAVSPQGPVTDWFIGDDFHHRGAFMLADAFSFFSGFGVPRPVPNKSISKGFTIEEINKYRFFLDAGPLKNFNKLYLGDSIKFWNDLMNHPDYDSWWQQRNTRNFVGGIKPAILVVGGLFDAEDLFGAWNLYKAIEEKNEPSHYNKIVMGPWFHGAWEGRSSGESVGAIKFGSPTSKYYQDSVEFPFFQHFLKNTGRETLPEALVFFTGENNWHRLNSWPPKNTTPTTLYLHPKKELSFSKPIQAPSQSPDTTLLFTAYTSDPANPVPHEGPGIIESRTREYMTADQRFTSYRKDVIRFQTPILTKSITLAGPVMAELYVSINSTDADFVVKLIDVFPADVSTKGKGADTVYRKLRFMNGYAMLVRAEILRGKYRNSFENPEPFQPGIPTRVKLELPDVAHTFQKGHRIMIEIQSSWFPLADRNPQVFTNIYKASRKDFRKARIKVHHSANYASGILLPVLEGNN